MSHRRSFAQQPREERQQQLRDVDECIAIMETTITNCNKKKHPVLALGQLLTWPMRLLSSVYCWLTLELGHVLEEKDSEALFPTDDPSKFLPSVASFVLGLLLVKNYGDSFDSVISSFLGSWCRGIRNFLDVLAGLSCDDLENIATVCVVVIFWIGAFRIVSNIVGKLAEAQKLYS